MSQKPVLRFCVALVTNNTPDCCSEDLPYHSYKIGWMDQIQCFKIFLVLPVKCSVCLPQPGEWRLVLACEAIMKVYKAVVFLNKLIQRIHQVPTTNSTLYNRRRGSTAMSNTSFPNTPSTILHPSLFLKCIYWQTKDYHSQSLVTAEILFCTEARTILLPCIS